MALTTQREQERARQRARELEREFESRNYDSRRYRYDDSMDTDGLITGYLLGRISSTNDVLSTVSRHRTEEPGYSSPSWSGSSSSSSGSSSWGGFSSPSSSDSGSFSTSSSFGDSGSFSTTDSF